MLKKLGISFALFNLSSMCLAGVVYLGPMAEMQTTTADQSSYRGVSPRITFGYDMELNSLYHVAAEVYATPTSAEIQDNKSPNAFSAKTTRSLGLSVLPEYVVVEGVRAYLRAGIVQTKFTSPGTNATGGQIGVGAQVKIDEHWDMRAEYSYIAYRAISTLGSAKTDIFGIGLISDIGWLLG